MSLKKKRESTFCYNDNKIEVDEDEEEEEEDGEGLWKEIEEWKASHNNKRTIFIAISSPV